MVAQTVQFETVSVSEIGSGTITAFLFSGTTLSATLGSIDEHGTLKGRHTGVVNDIAAGKYRLVVKFDGYTINEPDEVVDLLLAVGTYVSYRAAVLDSDSITAVQSGLATSASITTLRGADNDTLKTLSDQIDGISSGGTDWTANERTAIRSILGVPASGTTPADPSVGILDTIRDSVGTYIAGISAVASTTTGTIVGFPSSLNLGDSYTEEANSDIHVFIRDENDDPIAAVGDFNFTDPEFAPEVNITQSGSTGRVKAVVTFIEASPEDYLKVEIPSSQSRRASPGTATIQCLLKWVDTDGKVLCQKTLSKQAVTWNEMV